MKEQLPAYQGPLDGEWITEQQAAHNDYRPMEFKGTIVGYMWNKQGETNES